MRLVSHNSGYFISPPHFSDDIERIQRRAMCIIFPSLLYCEAMDKAGIPTLSERRESLSINYLTILYLIRTNVRGFNFAICKRSRN